jgi:hypothetical protein
MMERDTHMAASSQHPKVFISYSWSGPEHESFVLELATALRSHGVDAILDKWRLKAGQDKYVFMESMVTDPDVVKVLVLCDAQYKAKADARTGGVGTESQIISQELYGKVAQSKFIPVICERGDEGEDCLPVFMKGRIFVDISSDEKYGEGLDELLRLIYEQPLYPEPGLGEAPAFLKPGSAGMPVAKELGGALRAIRDGKRNREGLERLFLKSVVTEIDRLYVRPEPKDGYDEPIYQAILKSRGLRDQLADYIDTVASFDADDAKVLRPYVGLLEQLGQRFGPPIENGVYADGWADIYRFFALEAVLVLVATMLRYERWDMLGYALRYPYLMRTSHSGIKAESIGAFDSHIVSMDEHRNGRLRANRISFTADMLKERCSPDKVSFAELVQADVFATLFGIANLTSTQQEGRHTYWAPRTAVYTSEAQKLPIFLKALDPSIRKGIWSAVGAKSAADLAGKVEQARAALGDFRRLAGDRFGRFSFDEAVNLRVLVS